VSQAASKRKDICFSYTVEDGADVFEQKSRCLHDATPPCIAACPIEMPIRSILSKLESGDVDRAALEFLDKAVLPATIAQFCEGYCENACVRTRLDEPIKMRELELFLYKGGYELPKKRPLPINKGKRICIVGISIVGLTCALLMLRKGYSVDLIEPSENLESAHDELSSISKDIFRLGVLEDYRLLQSYDHFFATFGKSFDFKNTVNYEAILLPHDHALPSGEPSDKQDNADYEDSLFKAIQQEGTLLVYIKDVNDVVEQIALGKEISKTIDQFAKHKIIIAPRTRESISAQFPISDQVKKEYSAVVPPITMLEVASEEAGRCLQCNCDLCMNACTLMKQGRMDPPYYIVEAQQSLKTQRRLHDKLNIRRVCGCNQCGLCREICPTDVDMGSVYRRSREIMQATNEMPEVFYDFWLRDLADNEEHAFVMTPDSRETVKYLYFPGCHLGSSNPNYVLQSYRYLLDQFDQDVAIDIHCCGAEAIWAGKQDMACGISNRFLDSWKSLGHPIVITACSSCRKYLSAISDAIHTISLWEVLDSNLFLPDEKSHREGTLTLFDPCSSRYFPQEQQAVRSLLEKSGVEFADFPGVPDHALCCGFGGLIYPANPKLFFEILQDRTSQSDLPYLTYCANCNDAFLWWGKDCNHLMDLLFDMESKKHFSHAKDISDRRKNRRALRRSIREDIFMGADSETIESHESIHLILTEEMRRKMMSQLILDSDIQRVIEQAERFNNRVSRNGFFVSYLMIGAVTVWVEYSVIDENTFDVRNVYSHRMKITGDQQHVG